MAGSRVTETVKQPAKISPVSTAGRCKTDEQCLFGERSEVRNIRCGYLIVPAETACLFMHEPFDVRDMFQFCLTLQRL